MGENEVPPKAGEQPPATPAPQASPSETTGSDSAPAPGYEEFGTAKRNLPPAAPVAIAIAVVAIVVAILAYTNRAKPAATGSIDGVWFSQPANMPSPMILIDVTVRNVSDKTLYIKDLKAAVKTDQGDQSDDAASATDYDRYLSAYPDLRGHSQPLQVEMKIQPGAEQKGSVMISPSVTQQQFDARKDVTVTIQPYDQRPIVLHEKTAAK